MTSQSPIVDLSSLPVDLQAVEYHYRLERGRTHPKAVKCTFLINRVAREIAESSWYSGQYWLAS